ncbi:MAG: serine/threonine protein kinase [Polyangiaceae bacterium]|nr:serine/threonine protein kinase [Polyangiaceae bacterium]
MSDLAEGALVDGRFRVDGVLGRGAMGVVYAATHERLAQPVALKVITKGVLGEGEARARFTREARVLARLSTRHAPRVLDIGELDDGPYMALERLRGQDLARRIEASPHFEIDEALTIAVQVLDALAEAHSLGVVHRDVKPANVFLAEVAGEGAVAKVLDFGISKAKEAPGGSLTGTHEMMGSPGYMAPEQILATSEVDPRADLWSWGALFYELLAGAPAFRGDAVGVVLAEVLEGRLEPVGARRGVPDALARVVHRCLEREIALRFATAGEIAAALAPHAPPELAHLLLRIQTLSEVRAPETVRDPRFAPPSTPRPTLPDLPRFGPAAETVAAPPATEVWREAPAARGGARPWLVALLVTAALVLGFALRALLVERG